MSKVLITGVSGLIGSTLAEKLIERGDQVLGIDNFSSGNKRNIENLNKNFEYFEADIIKPIDIPVDFIVHLASITDPVLVKQNSVAVMEANTTGLLNLLKLAESQKISLLFASSIRVLDNTTDCYREGKRTGELLCNEYGAKIARMGNVYGPRMDKNDGRVIPTFLRKTLANENITIWGDGSQIDSFCYVSDIVDGLCKFMDSNYSGVIEFGSAELVTISDLANLIITECNSKSSISFTKDKVDPTRKVVDISKAKELLRWDPKMSLKEGINYITSCILKNKI